MAVSRLRKVSALLWRGAKQVPKESNIMKENESEGERELLAVVVVVVETNGS
jgi:hypothetical protein